MTEFDQWIAEEIARTGPFTALLVLTQIDGDSVTPVCSTYVNVIGAEVDWSEMTVLLAGSGVRWDGVSFFVTTAEAGGPLPNVQARTRLGQVEAAIREDRLHLNRGHFFDVLGRRMQVEEVTAAGHA